MTALCYPMLPEFRKGFAFWKVCRFCIAVLVVREINLWMEMSVERWWNGAERGKRSTGREMSYIFTALEINVQKCIYTVHTVHIYSTGPLVV
jgi:hypothetical protein